MGQINPEAKEQILETICNRVRLYAQHMTGSSENDGLVISSMVRILANLYENIIESEGGEDELSGPRMGILIRLVEEERQGNLEGITPTLFSRGQHVTRNTVSALLKGLEEQGYIERSLDPRDKRLFRIKLSDAGRQKAIVRAPLMIEQANRLVSSMAPGEREQLISLMGRLFASLHQNSQACPDQKN